MPKITICIPAYNAAFFISQTLETLLRQTYQDFIIVVSDNNSTDSTVAIVKDYQGRDPRILLTSCPVPRQDGSLRTASLSAIDNINHLLSMVESEFIALYHADDLYHAEILADEIELLQGNEDMSAVFAMGRLLNSTGTRISIRSIAIPSSLANQHIFSYESLLSATMREGLQLMTPTCMMRRKAMIKAGLFRNKYEQASDYDYWLRLAKMGPVGIIDCPLFLRREGKHSDSFRGQTLYKFSHLPAVRLFEDHVVAMMEVCHEASGSLVSALRRIEGRDELRIARNLVREGRGLEAAAILKRGLAQNGNLNALGQLDRVHAALLKKTACSAAGRLFVSAHSQWSRAVRRLKWKTKSLRPADLMTHA